MQLTISIYFKHHEKIKLTYAIIFQYIFSTVKNRYSVRYISEKKDVFFRVVEVLA